MVRGCAIAVTAVAGTYQWAEMASTACGRGRAVPIACQACVQGFGAQRIHRAAVPEEQCRQAPAHDFGCCDSNCTAAW